MKKLDKSRVEWIIAQERNGVAMFSIAETMNVSARWVKKLWTRYMYANAGKIVYPVPMGRPKNDLLRRREYSAVLATRTKDHLDAVRMHEIIQASTGIDIPCSIIHKMLRDENLTSENPKKSGMRKWIHFARKHFNLMWYRLQAA